MLLRPIIKKKKNQIKIIELTFEIFFIFYPKIRYEKKKCKYIKIVTKKLHDSW